MKHYCLLHDVLPALDISMQYQRVFEVYHIVRVTMITCSYACLKHSAGHVIPFIFMVSPCPM